MRGLIRQGEVASRDLREEMRHGRHDHLDRADALGKERERLAEDAGKPCHLAAAAARHGQHDRRVGDPAPRLGLVRAKL